MSSEGQLAEEIARRSQSEPGAAARKWNRTFFPQREIFRIHYRQVVLAHRNLETGKAVIGHSASNEIYDVSDTLAVSVTITGLPFNYKDPDGGILIKNAGRIILGPSGVEFEAGQHPELEPDFITFMCTALS